MQKGSFYHFFPSKVELALAVIDRYSAGGLEALERLVDGPGSPLSRLVDYLDGLGEAQVELRASCGRVLGCPIGNLGLEMSTQEPALRERLRREVDRSVEAFDTVLEQAVATGELKPRDTRRTARSLLALVEGTLMLAKMNDDPRLLSDLRRDVLLLIGAEAPS